MEFAGGGEGGEGVRGSHFGELRRGLVGSFSGERRKGVDDATNGVTDEVELQTDRKGTTFGCDGVVGTSEGLFLFE